MAKKKKAKSVNNRVAEHRARMRENGYRQVAVLLPAPAIARLDRLAKSSDQTRAEVIADLLKPAPVARKATAKKSAKKKSAKKKIVKPAIPKGGNCSLCGQYQPDAELNELLTGANRYKGAQCMDSVACNKVRGIVK